MFLAKKFPAATLSVLNLAAGIICGVIHHPELSAAFVAAAAGFLGLHVTVVPKKAATETAVKAATDAATTTAANLTTETVGKLGEVTGDAGVVVKDAVGLVTGLLGVK